MTEGLLFYLVLVLVQTVCREWRRWHALRHTTAAMTRRYTMQKDKGESARTLADVMLAKTA